MQGISHLKQLSKLGAHLRQISFSHQGTNKKMASEIKNCENLALEMDLQLHEKKMAGVPETK